MSSSVSYENPSKNDGMTIFSLAPLGFVALLSNFSGDPASCKRLYYLTGVCK
jgi:hypothetical protein